MYTDPASGLTDMPARSYDPATGTFTTADTLAGTPLSPPSLNRYLYGDGDPVGAFDPDGHWPWSGWWNNFWDWLTQTVPHAASQAWDTVTHTAGQALDAVTQAVDTARQVAADAAHTVSQIAHAIGPTLRATLASAVVGGAVFLGCEAITAGTGSIGCATAGWAVGGAIYGAMTCPPGTATAHCALTGGLAGAAAGLTAGLSATLGLSALTTGALASAAGDATNQYLTTGHINPAQLLTSAAIGAATFGAASKLAPSTEPALTDLTELARNDPGGLKAQVPQTRSQPLSLRDTQTSVLTDTQPAPRAAEGSGTSFASEATPNLSSRIRTGLSNDVGAIRIFRDNGYVWPRNNGFEGPPLNTTLPRGYQFDRLGGDPATDSGRFASPAGTPFEMRSLPRSSLSRTFTTYEVVIPFDAQIGVVRPWGGMPGGGFQLNFYNSIAELVKMGNIQVAP